MYKNSTVKVSRYPTSMYKLSIQKRSCAKAKIEIFCQYQPVHQINFGRPIFSNGYPGLIHDDDREIARERERASERNSGLEGETGNTRIYARNVTKSLKNRMRTFGFSVQYFGINYRLLDTPNIENISNLPPYVDVACKTMTYFEH